MARECGLKKAKTIKTRTILKWLFMGDALEVGLLQIMVIHLVTSNPTFSFILKLRGDIDGRKRMG